VYVKPGGAGMSQTHSVASYLNSGAEKAGAGIKISHNPSAIAFIAIIRTIFFIKVLL
jgi:hypothetical protein